MMNMMLCDFNHALALFLNLLFHPFRSRNSTPERRRNGFNSGNGPIDFSELTPQQTILELQKASKKSWDLLFDTLRLLASASDSKDVHTRGHSERVTRFSIEIAQIMGLPEDEIERIGIGALVHDIGKITIDSNILTKPTLLTDSEYEIMKTHTIRGYELLEQIPRLQSIKPATRFHHERLDGKGYPYGLKGDEIPRIVRVITVADCFDAMTTTRIYQDPTPVEYVLGMIRSAAGVKYDEHVVEALVHGVRKGRIIARSEDSMQNRLEVSRS